MNTRDDDPVKHILVVDTHDTLLFFTDTGRVLSMKSYDLRADISRNTRGVPIVNVIAMSDRERINAVVGVENLQQENTYLVMGTRRGKIKRVTLDAVSAIRPSGLIIMNLKPDDDLVAARLATDEDDVFFITEQGMSIRFSVSQVPLRQRTAGGVKGLTLRPKDQVVSMDIGRPEGRLLVISKRGYGKLTPLKSYRTQSRGGLGIKTFNITRKTGLVAAAEVIDDSTEVYVVSEEAQVLRTSLSEISSMGRATQGVTIFKPKPGDAVSSIACVRDLNKQDGPEEEPDKASTNGKSDEQMPLDGLK